MQMFFDWSGTRDELDAWVKKYKEACKKNGITFRGYYAPPQDRYHWVLMAEYLSEIPDQTKLSAPFREVGFKPPQMGHMITKYYVPQG